MSLSLHYLVYQSTATAPLSERVLALLLAKARARNEGRRITGLLLYCGGDFLQVLEGPQPDVHTLFDTICRDPRHGNVLLLADGPLTHRGFTQWSMAFETPCADDFARLKGFINLGQPGQLTAAQTVDPSLYALLLAFVHQAGNRP